jgi:2-methylcitrate dehydratase PrpD
MRADRPEVTTGREATVSAQHVAAAALLRGRVGPAELTDQAVADPAIQALRARVTVGEDPAVPVEAVHLAARLADGSTREVEVPMGRGLPDRPLTDAELEAKARLLIAWGAPWCDAGAVIGPAWAAEEPGRLGMLCAALRPGA